MVDFFKNDAVRAVLLLLAGWLLGIFTKPFHLWYEETHKKRTEDRQKQKDQVDPAKNIRRSTDGEHTLCRVNPYWVEWEGSKARFRGHPDAFVISSNLKVEPPQFLDLDKSEVELAKQKKDWLLFLELGPKGYHLQQREAASIEDLHLFVEPSEKPVRR